MNYPKMAHIQEAGIFKAGLAGTGGLPGAAVPAKEMRRIYCYGALSIGDILAISISFLSTHYWYARSLEMTHGIVMLAVIAPIYLMVAGTIRAYTGTVLEDPRIGIWRALQAFFFSASSVLFIAYFLKAGQDFSRLVFGLSALSSVILLTINRLLLYRPIIRILQGSPYVTVIITDGVRYNPEPFDILLDAQAMGFEPTTKDPFRYHYLAQMIGEADRVIIACPHERYGPWSSVLKGMALAGEIVTHENDDIGIIGISEHNGRRTMVVAAGPLLLRDRIFKRALDVVISGLSFIVLFPVFIVVAIAIKLESKGPILFVQSRIGRDNKLFRMYKFRSMYTDVCDAEGAQSTSRNDSRITRVGDFIRRTSIDELPQILNVLKGDMSIVGPRPHPLSARAADLLFWDIDPRYRHRHSMKPGLTGLAQVQGYRGATEKLEDLTNRLQADLDYANNWSLWKDIRIILQTFLVLRHQNAY